MPIVYSAPAKVILSGEHSVVFGKPSLAVAISLRLRTHIEESEVTSHPKDFEQIEKHVRAFLQKENKLKNDRNYRCVVESDIPINRNLGSSAAFSVASVAALLDFYSEGLDFTLEVINDLSYKAEKFFHGSPSGVDNTVSTFGGLLYYRKEFEFLKTLSLLQFKIPKNIEDRLYLLDSGEPVETTAEMVSLVGGNYNKNPEKVQDLFSKAEKHTKRMVVSIIKKDADFFAHSLKEADEILQDLGIVSGKTKKLIKDLSDLGVAKVTGAGGVKSGSGHLIFFAHSRNHIEKELRERKINYIKFRQDYGGVNKES